MSAKTNPPSIGGLFEKSQRDELRIAGNIHKRLVCTASARRSRQLVAHRLTELYCFLSISESDKI
jgi:hypothetical protein